MTIQAFEEMVADDLGVFDVESVIMTGKVMERQRDPDSGEWKYRIRGSALDDEEAEAVVKLGPTGRAVIITVYRV